MSTMRLHRLHFNSTPSLRSLAISSPHLQRVSWQCGEWAVAECTIMFAVKGN